MSDSPDSMIQRRKDSPAGAGHYHIADRYPFRVTVSIGGREVASSDDAIILKEVGKSVYNPSFYLPRGDVEVDLLRKEPGFSTHCPIKGEASYWAYVGGTEPIDRAAWSYDAPLDYSGMIEGRIGFDQRYATIEIKPT